MPYRKKHGVKIVAAFLMFLLFLFSGCGYVPSSRYVKKVTGDKVSVQVVISLVDPQNTVLIKDALSNAVIKNFQARLVPPSEAQTQLVVQLESVSYAPLQYDTNGYIVSYRTTVVLTITMKHDGKSKSYSETGIYDFPIEPNAIISDQLRFTAIKNGASKAITAFVAQVSAVGATKENR
jgi:hypothetical protein